MRKIDPSLHSRVFYRPIEAAIRWSGLLRFEARILDSMNGKVLPHLDDFPRWPMLCLNAERIFDGLRNGELPYGRSGITSNDPALLDDLDLTIRHVDLKVWMTRFYPDQRPTFLFDDIERRLHPAIGIDTVQTLLADREALKARLVEMERSFDVLRERHRVLCKQIESRSAAEHEVSPRSEATYLNIVGGLMGLLLGKSPSGKPYSSFETMESVISALLAHHAGRPGMAERTLWAKLAQARRQVEDAPR
ncbi:MAG: ATP-binding protein [Rhodanobacter sp.]